MHRGALRLLNWKGESLRGTDLSPDWVGRGRGAAGTRFTKPSQRSARGGREPGARETEETPRTRGGGGSDLGTQAWGRGASVDGRDWGELRGILIRDSKG